MKKGIWVDRNCFTCGKNFFSPVYKKQKYCKKYCLDNRARLVDKRNATKFLRYTKILNTFKNSFYNRVLLPDENGCMKWTGGKNKGGYGLLCRPHESIHTLAHRFSYEIHYGKFDKKFLVCHTCDNRICVAPSHLFLGDHKINAQDMVKKDRGNIKRGNGNPFRKLSESQVKEIKYKLMNGSRLYSLAKEYNISRAAIGHIKHGRSWTYLDEGDCNIV